MSEKIIITKEQDERIKLEIHNGDYSAIALDCHISGWADKKNQCLNSLSVSEMARILYEPGSFEVEKPKIKIGDYVAIEKGENFIHSGKKFARVSKVGDFTVCVDDKYGSFTHDFIRLATPIETVFAELGREVGVFVEGDIGVSNSGMNWERSYNIEREYRNGNLKGFYPAGTFIKLP